MTIIRGLREMIEKSVEVEVVKIDSFDKLGIEEEGISSDTLLPAFNNVIGSSITEAGKEGLQLNLLPREYKEKVVSGEKLKSMLMKPVA